MAFINGAAIWLPAKPVLEDEPTLEQGPEQYPQYKLQLNLRFSHNQGVNDSCSRPKSETQGPHGFSIEPYPTPWNQWFEVTIKYDVGTELDLIPLLPRLLREGPYTCGPYNPDHEVVWYLMADIKHNLRLHQDYVILLFNGIQINTFDNLGTKLAQVFNLPLQRPFGWHAAGCYAVPCKPLVELHSLAWPNCAFLL